MKLDVRIKNLGKLRNTGIKVRPLTIVAGVNSSGKSFFTKSFYSVLKAHSTDHITNAFKTYLENIVTLLKYIEADLPHRSQKDVNYIKEINEQITFVSEVVSNQLSSINLYEQFQILETAKFRKYFDELSVLIEKFITNLKDKPTKYEKVSQFIEDLQKSIKSISEITREPESFNFMVLVPNVSNELRENFQIRKLSDLASKTASTTEETSITIEGMVSLRFSQRGSFAYEGDKQWRKNIKNPTTVIFFESPVYWRLKDVFDSIERTSKQSQYLIGIPKYFYDIAHLLRLTPKAEVEFPEILEKITKTIRGQILLSPTGSLIYKDDKYEYSLNMTASGISNLGMIGLLLEKNIITKGSFLIIDEPETNLHPEWQMVLMEILFELSQRGVNVVIATHSLDLVECLSVILEKAVHEQKDITDLVGINLLDENGENEEMSDDILLQVRQVHKNLSAPYVRKRVESLKYD